MTKQITTRDGENRLTPAAQNRGSKSSNLKGNFIQPKLTVGQPDDKYEQEADRVADQVLSTPSSETVQRSCSSCMEDKNSLQTKPLAASITPLVQRQPMEEEEEEIMPKPLLQRQPMEEEEEELMAKPLLQRQPLEEEEEELMAKPLLQRQPEEEEEELQTKIVQRKGKGDHEAVPSDFENNINQSRGSGQSLSADTQSFMGSRFGNDFSNVKVHSDSTAVQMNKEVNSQAFTVGNNIYFNSGRYNPDSSSGKQLLAHELTHTIQQNGSKPSRLQRWSNGAAPPLADWQVIPNAQHQRRLNQAETIISGVLGSRRCQNYFENNCTNGAGPAALQNAFDNAVVYYKNVDNEEYGESIGNDIAYNTRSYRIGRYFMASTLLHEMFHTCDPIFDARDEIDAENAVETCRLHTPFISDVTPTSAPVGAQVTISGVSFGEAQGANDRVEFNGVNGNVLSWGFVGGAGNSGQRIVVEVPAGATSGNLVVINNNVRSNRCRFTVV